MRQITYSSKISRDLRTELEKLLFFNPLQARCSKGIDEVVDRYGFPRIVEYECFLQVAIGDLPDVQCLFALDDAPPIGNLLGVLLYYRTSAEEVIVIHIAVDKNCSAFGEFSNELVVLRMIQKLKEDLQRVRGVKKILISYNSRFDTLFRANL